MKLHPVRQTQLPMGHPFLEYQFPNGLRLFIVENHSAPVFTFQTWIQAGSVDEKMDPNLQVTGLAHLFEHMMFRGTQKVPDGEFDRILTQNGVQDENATTWFERTNYFESLPASKLELVLQLESDRMQNLRLDKDLLETEKKAVIGEFHMCQDDPDHVASELLYDTAFKAHPFRYSVIGTQKEIQSFTLEQALYFYRTYYVANRTVIFVVGDVNPQDTARMVEQYYQNYRTAPHSKKQNPIESKQTRFREATFYHRQLVQTKLLLAHPAPPVHAPEFASFWVFDSLLTSGRSSLLKEIWLNEELATSVESDIDRFSEGGLMVISAEFDGGKKEAAKLTKILQDALQKKLLKDPKYFEDSLERAKNLLLLEIYSDWEENGSLASYMGEYIFSMGDPLKPFELVEKIKSVNRKDIETLLAQVWNPATFTQIMGLPISKKRRKSR